MVFALVATMFACSDDNDNNETPTIPGMYKATYSITIDGQKIEGTINNSSVQKYGDGLCTFAAVKGNFKDAHKVFGISVSGYAEEVGKTVEIDGDDVGFAVVNAMISGKKMSVYSTSGTITRTGANKLSFSGKVTLGGEKMVNASGYVISEAISHPNSGGLE